MRLADIVIALDPSTPGREHMHAALKLASRFGAHATGYYTGPTSGVVRDPRAGMRPAAGGEPSSPGAVVAAGDLAEDLRSAFELEAKARGVEAVWVLGAKPADRSGLVALARYADLVVCGLAPVPGYQEDFPTIDLEALVVEAGCPILGLPVAPVPESIGRNAVVAWDGSREASRAVRDALPLLRDAESVTIISIGAGDHALDAPANLVAHLKRSGVAATIDVDHRLHLDTTGDEILNRLESPDLDLLVAGAFGHSRASERLFGGASRSFLHQMMVPVLVSH